MNLHKYPEPANNINFYEKSSKATASKMLICGFLCIYGKFKYAKIHAGSAQHGKTVQKVLKIQSTLQRLKDEINFRVWISNFYKSINIRGLLI